MCTSNQYYCIDRFEREYSDRNKVTGQHLFLLTLVQMISFVFALLLLLYMCIYDLAFNTTNLHRHRKIQSQFVLFSLSLAFFFAFGLCSFCQYRHTFFLYSFFFFFSSFFSHLQWTPNNQFFFVPNAKVNSSENEQFKSFFI